MVAKRGTGAKLKKCIISTITRSKITTPKSAQRAFNAAARKCRKVVLGETVPRKKKSRKSRVARIPRRGSGIPRSPRNREAAYYDPYEGVAPMRARRTMKIVRV